ncbi:MAG: hypothetical protein QM762_05810 [Chryseolinea sp.]
MKTISLDASFSRITNAYALLVEQVEREPFIGRSSGLKVPASDLGNDQLLSCSCSHAEINLQYVFLEPGLYNESLLKRQAIRRTE